MVPGSPIIQRAKTDVVFELDMVRVDMAEMKVETKPVELVSCVGSCVAVCLFDSSSKCGGMAHVMLPQKDISPKENLPAKFADSAVPALISAMKRKCTGSVFSAKIAGGANMFPNIKNHSLAIGARNAEAVKAALAENKIPLRGEDIGGTHGRKVTFNTLTGIVNVRVLNGEVKKL